MRQRRSFIDATGGLPPRRLACVCVDEPMANPFKWKHVTAHALFQLHAAIPPHKCTCLASDHTEHGHMKHTYAQLLVGTKPTSSVLWQISSFWGSLEGLDSEKEQKRCRSKLLETVCFALQIDKQVEVAT
jgi:hypothetical protein